MLPDSSQPTMRSLSACARVVRSGCLALGVLALLALPAQAAQRDVDADPIGDYYTDALNMLYANGWHDVSDLQLTGHIVHAVAVDKNGQSVRLAVDPRDHTIMPD